MAAPQISRTGVPDMKPIVAGGPSARGTAMGGAAEVILGLLRQAIYLAGGATQNAKAQQDVKAVGGKVDTYRRTHPTQGVLISLQFIVQEAAKEAAGSGNAYRYVGYLWGNGATMSEAQADQARRGWIRPGTRSNEKYAYQSLWFPPHQASARLQRPFPVIGHGCFVEGKVWLQDVMWTTLQGFDDEGKTSLAGSGNSFYFDVLKPPSSIVTTHGGTGAVKLPLVQRMVGIGGITIPVVDLDTSVGSVTAAMVFPADAHTEAVFGRAPATKQKPLGTIRGIVNFDRVRWVRPENIRLVKSAADTSLPV